MGRERVKLAQYPLYLWRRLSHNLAQKLLALLAAVGVWFLATEGRRTLVDRTFDVPLTVSDSTPGGQRRAPAGLPRTVRVTVQGPNASVQPLDPDEVKAAVDITNVPEGNFTQRVRVSVPNGVQVTRYTPGSVNGFLDAESTRTLPVALSVTNLPADAIPRYEVSPETVRVSGPKRSVDLVARVINTPVGLDPGASREARLIAVNVNGSPVQDVTTEPGTVTVIRRDSGQLPVKAVRVVLPTPPTTLEVVASDIEPASVRLVSSPDLLARLREVSARVPYQVGKYSVRASLDLPDGVRSLDVVVVTLEVRRKP